MFIHLVICAGVVFGTFSLAKPQQIVKSNHWTCVQGGGDKVCAPDVSLYPQVYVIAELRRLTATLNARSKEMTELVKNGNQSLTATIEEGNAQLSSMEKTLSEQVNVFQAEFKTSIQKLFENLPAELLTSPEITQLRKDILEEVDRRIAEATR